MELNLELKTHDDYFANANICAAVEHDRIFVSKTHAEAQAITTQALTEWKSFITRTYSNETPGIVISDRDTPDLPVVYASPLVESITGYHPSEMLGRNCRFLQRPDQLTPSRYIGPLPAFNGFDPNRTVLRQKIRDGEAANVKIINYHKTGRAFLNELLVVPVDFQGSQYFVGFVNDVTPEHDMHGLRLAASTDLQDLHVVDQQHPVVNPADPPVWPPSTTSASSDQPEYASPNVPSGWAQSDTLLSNLATVQGQIVCVISLSGHVLFLPPDVNNLLGHPPQAFYQHSLFDIIHPQDTSAFRAELRKLVPGTSREIICRALTADGSAVYIDFCASRNSPSTAAYPHVVLSGNVLPATTIPERILVAEISSRHPPLWAKISMSGLILYGTSAFQSLFQKSTPSEQNFEQSDIIGLSLQSRLCQESCNALGRALATMSDGVVPSVDLRHCFMRPDGSKLAMVTSLLLPQGVSLPTAPIRPSFVLVRMQYAVSDTKTTPRSSRRRSSKLPMRITSDAKCYPRCIATFEPSPTRVTVAANRQQPQGQACRPLVARSPLTVQTTFQDHSSLDSASFGFDPPLTPELTLNPVPMQPDDTTAPWRYSINRLALENERLREKLQDYATRASARHRRMRARQHGQNCANCGTWDTPEWRKGPLGTRTLCNRCGLKYAKEKLNQQQDQKDAAEFMDEIHTVETKKSLHGEGGQGGNDDDHGDPEDGDDGGDGTSGSCAMDTD